MLEGKLNCPKCVMTKMSLNEDNLLKCKSCGHIIGKEEENKFRQYLNHIGLDDSESPLNLAWGNFENFDEIDLSNNRLTSFLRKIFFPMFVNILLLIIPFIFTILSIVYMYDKTYSLFKIINLNKDSIKLLQLLLTGSSVYLLKIMYQIFLSKTFYRIKILYICFTYKYKVVFKRIVIIFYSAMCFGLFFIIRNFL